MSVYVGAGVFCYTNNIPEQRAIRPSYILPIANAQHLTSHTSSTQWRYLSDAPTSLPLTTFLSITNPLCATGANTVHALASRGEIPPQIRRQRSDDNSQQDMFYKKRPPSSCLLRVFQTSWRFAASLLVLGVVKREGAEDQDGTRWIKPPVMRSRTMERVSLRPIRTPSRRRLRSVCADHVLEDGARVAAKCSSLCPVHVRNVVNNGDLRNRLDHQAFVNDKTSPSAFPRGVAAS